MKRVSLKHRPMATEWFDRNRLTLLGYPMRLPLRLHLIHHLVGLQAMDSPLALSVTGRPVAVSDRILFVPFFAAIHLLSHHRSALRL